MLFPLLAYCLGTFLPWNISVTKTFFNWFHFYRWRVVRICRQRRTINLLSLICTCQCAQIQSLRWLMDGSLSQFWRGFSRSTLSTRVCTYGSIRFGLAQGTVGDQILKILQNLVRISLDTKAYSTVCSQGEHEILLFLLLQAIICRKNCST